jgi:hypothetical protein
VYEKLDIGSNICGIYLNLQKAIDSMSHDILLTKMYNCGVQEIVYNWFESYLINKNNVAVYQMFVLTFIVYKSEYLKDHIRSIVIFNIC